MTKTVTEYFRQQHNVGFVDNVLVHGDDKPIYNDDTQTIAVIRQHDDGEYLDDAGNVIIEECELSTFDLGRELALAACG